MDAASLQKGVAAGTITIEQVLEVLHQQVEENRQLREMNRRLTARVVSVVRVSLDQTCALLQFFCGLPIEKSQVNTLLNQLAWHWQPDYDALGELVARAKVVYLDETSWKIDAAGCSLWALQSPDHRVLKLG